MPSPAELAAVPPRYQVRYQVSRVRLHLAGCGGRRIVERRVTGATTAEVVALPADLFAGYRGQPDFPRGLRRPTDHPGLVNYPRLQPAWLLGPALDLSPGSRP